MKILHVINSLTIGGSQNLLANHVSRLSRDHGMYASEVCVLGRRSGAAQEYLDRLPVPPRFLDFEGDYRDVRQAAPCVARLRRLMRERAPSIVHSYLWSADVFASVASAGLPIKRVAHILDRRGRRSAANRRERWRTVGTGWLLRRGGTRFAAVSETCRAFAITEYLLDPDDVVTAHNGIEPAGFEVTARPLFTRRPATIGMVSRFVEEKGHSYLVEAFRLLAAQRLDVRMILAGNGPALSEVQQQVARLGLADRVEFVGRVASSAAFYRDLDVFVVPSIHSEGLPTTILEAMATGVPVVATDVGGATEAVEDGTHGLVVPPRDAGALAQALAWLIGHPEDARRFGQAAAQHVRSNFTADRMTRTIVERVYGPLLAPNSGEARTV